MGLIEVRVTLDPIDLGKVASWSPHSKHGAINSFVGIVRSSNLGREVVAMEYDCFIPLCEKTFTEIALEAQQKWANDANIFILHRHGRLAVGEASVAIVATTGHRDESYRITRYIIEEIKTRAPIWKKEHYKDGETEWVQGHALCQHRKVDHHEHSGGHSCGGKVHSHETR
jgi:molybdopterin synthase catalytic subunit